MLTHPQDVLYQTLFLFLTRHRFLVRNCVYPLIVILKRPLALPLQVHVIVEVEAENI